MKERFLIVNSISGTELIRTLARFGSGTFMLRVFNAAELATEGLVRSGKPLAERFLSRNEEVYVIDRFLKENAYFEVSSFSDANDLSKAIYQLRMMVGEDEEKTVEKLLSQGEFLDKNEAIADIYRRYTAYLKDNGLIDTVGLLRRSIELCERIDAEFITLKEYPLEPLERKLAEKLSGNELKEMSVLELFDREEKELKIDEYIRAYGTVNELEDLLSFIYRNRIPFDRCLIVTPKDSYAQYIYDLTLNDDLPVTFATGLNIANSSAFGLLKLLIAHKGNEYGTDTLRTLLFSDLLDRDKLLRDIGADEKRLEDIVKAAGSLRFSFDNEMNDLRYRNFEVNALNDRYRKQHVDPVRKLKDIFDMGPVAFLREYATIRDRIDSEGLQTVCRSIEDYLAKREGDIGELLPVLSKRYICRDLSKEGYIHVSGIRNALSCLREYVFVVGLSSSQFPGQPKENYLLLDSDIDLFTKDGHTSVNIIEEKIKELNALLKTASSLDCHIKLSFSDFNIAALKSENPSSFLFDTFRKEYPDKDYDEYLDSFRKTSYFEHGLRKDEKLGKAYIEGKEIVASIREEKEDAIPPIDMRFAPTQIETFFSCPRRFYLKYVLGIKEPEEDDPYTVISAADIGILYHSLMEKRANRDMSVNDFLSLADKAFEDFMTLRPEIHDDAKERAKADFLEMCRKGFGSDPNNHVEAAEEFQRSECYGVKLKGFPDRIEKDRDGNYLIADFKTGREIHHDETDLVTCLQVLLYAYMAEKELGYDIKYCEYRYPRLENTVTCYYNDEAKDELASLMDVFRNALKTGAFPCADRKDWPEACRYCKLAAICGKEEGGEDDE